MTDLPTSPELLDALLDISLSGVVLYQPVRDAAGAVVDFAFERLNPAAQRMLQLPAEPAGLTHLQVFSQAGENGGFAFHRDTYLSGQAGQFEVNYQADGLDNYFRVAARRVGGRLLVSFTDTADQPRTAVEEALRASQARERAAHAEAERQRQQLQLTFMQAPAMICIFEGPRHVFELVNPPYQALVGERPLLGLPIAEAMPELAGQPIFALLDRVYETGEPFHATEMLVQLDHANTSPTELEKRYYNFIYQARRDGQGTINGIVVFAYEVTQQVLARQQMQRFNEELEARVAERTRQLTQQQALLSQILGQVPAAIATLSGPEHRFSFFNDQYQLLSGQRTRLGLTVAEVLPEVLSQGFIELLDQVYATGQPFIGSEMPAELYDPRTGRPELHYVDFIYQPMLDGAGQSQGILAFIIDATTKVRAHLATEASVRQLRLITDALPVLIGYLDREQRYQFTNHAYREWFDQDPAALLGRPVREVVGEAAYANARPYIERALAGERVDFEARMPYRQDFVKYIRTSYVPDVHGGQVQGFYSLVTDVTEQTLAREQVQRLNHELAAINGELKEANQELQQTNSRLLHTNADLDNFIYTASHDLKAPITNIEGLLLALREHLPAEAWQQELVPQLMNMMQGAVERFQLTISQLADITRLQEAHAQPAELVDLPALIEDVRLDLAPALLEAGAELTVAVAECPLVSFSPKNLRSLIFNLLSNAVKYRHPDRRPVLRLHCQHVDGQLLLAMHDNGLGLDELQRSKLFGMFQRLHTHVEGSGIGLYMVKRIAENAGGSISVESQPGVGSTFTVRLPA